MKISYIVEYTLSPNKFDKLFINYLEKSGFTVNIYDISFIFNKKFSSTHNTFNKNYHFCKSLFYLFYRIYRFNPDFVFCLITKRNLSNYFKRVLTVNILNFVFKTIEYPGPDVPTPEKSKKYILLKKILFEHAYSNYSYSIVSGTKSLDNATGLPIYINSPDYNSYIKYNSNAIESSDVDDYFVFLDQNYPYHQDWNTCNLSAPVTADIYYSEINTILKKISKIFNLRPVIQLHPSSDLLISSKAYNYTISKSSTFEIINKAKFVITHDSTAIQFAVFLNKPIFLILPSEVQARSVFTYSSILSMASAISCPIIMANDDFSSLQIHSPCKRAYKDFIGKYSKYDVTDHRTSEEILSSFLTNIR